MKVPSIVMWYEDYETEFEASSDKLFDFLEAVRIDHAYQFHPGKSYLNYFNHFQSSHKTKRFVTYIHRHTQWARKLKKVQAKKL